MLGTRLWWLQLLHTSEAGVGKQLDDRGAEVFLVQTQLRGGGKVRSLVRGRREYTHALRSTQRIVSNAGGLGVSGGSAVSLGSEVFMTDLEATKP